MNAKRLDAASATGPADTTTWPAAPSAANGWDPAIRDIRRQFLAKRRGSGVRRYRSTVFERDNFTCQMLICYFPGVPLVVGGDPHDQTAPQIDHVIPIAEGGSNSPDNIRASHGLCNREAWNHHAEEVWAASDPTGRRQAAFSKRTERRAARLR